MVGQAQQLANPGGVIAHRADGAAAEPDPFGRITLEEAENLEGLCDVFDPAERMNRRLYWFNAKSDDHVLLQNV